MWRLWVWPLNTDLILVPGEEISCFSVSHQPTELTVILIPEQLFPLETAGVLLQQFLDFLFSRIRRLFLSSLMMKRKQDAWERSCSTSEQVRQELRHNIHIWKYILYAFLRKSFLRRFKGRMCLEQVFLNGVPQGSVLVTFPFAMLKAISIHNFCFSVELALKG